MSPSHPIVLTLNVRSVEETAAWYERVLGWQGHFDTFDRSGACLFGSVACQTDPFVGFNLARARGGGTPETRTYGSIWIYVDDVDALYDRVAEAGWSPETPIEDKFWGERQFRLRDLNGNLLVITQSTEDLDLDEIRTRHEETLNSPSANPEAAENACCAIDHVQRRRLNHDRVT
jgi:uncharacterized glyoxalase superfamily protein PhnB